MMKNATEYAAIVASYAAQGIEAMPGKGSGLFVRGRGFVTLAQARKDTGVNMAQPKPARAVLPYGDYAVIAALNGRLNG